MKNVIVFGGGIRSCGFDPDRWNAYYKSDEWLNSDHYKERQKIKEEINWERVSKGLKPL